MISKTNTKQIEFMKKFEDFLEQFYHDKIHDPTRTEKKHIVIDFSKLIMFDPKLGEYVLDNPEDAFKVFELASKQLNENLPETFFIRLKNVHKYCKVPINSIRSKHINKLISVEGMVKQKSDVRAQVLSAKFECPACANILNVIQLDERTFREPTKCGCGRKGKFILLNKEEIDVFSIAVEESTDLISGGTKLCQLKVLCKGGLTSTLIERTIYQGVRIEIVGVLTEFQQIGKGGKLTNRIDWFLDANYINVYDESFMNLKWTKKDEEKFEQLAERKDWLKALRKSIFYDIHGYEEECEGIILQMFSGVGKNRAGAKIRGTIHVLLVGDPGTSKSTLLKIAQKFNPKSMYVAGSAVSGVGLTASVTRDELLGGYSVAGNTIIPVLVDENKINLIKIEELYYELKLNKTFNFKFLGVDEKTKSVKWVSCNGVARHKYYGEIIDLKQKRGQATCTKSHSIYDLNMKTFLPKENKKMYNIYNIDTIVNSKISLDLIQPTAKGRDKKTGRFLKGTLTNVIKSELTKDSEIKNFLTLCANYISEGCLYYRNRNHGVFISNQNKEFIKRTISAFDKLTGSKNKFPSYMAKDGCFTAGLFSKQLYIWLNQNCGKYSYRKKIPSFVYTLPEKYKTYFIDRLIEGDGTIKTNVRYEYTTNSKELATNFCFLLATINIKTSIRYNRVRQRKGGHLIYTIRALYNNYQDWQKCSNQIEITKAKGEFMYDIVSSETKNFVGGLGNILLHNTLDAGAIVLCNNGVLCIDELDKVDNEFKKALHEPLSESTVSIAKANIQATLVADTSVLAAANPKLGSYSDFDSVYSQIDLTPTLINRFDLVYPIRETALDENDDYDIAMKILSRRDIDENDVVELDKQFIKKYISFAKTITPEMPLKIQEFIAKKYKALKNLKRINNNQGTESIPVSGRNVDGFRRVIEAVARSRLHKIITREDAIIGYKKVIYSIQKVGIDPETGDVVEEFISGKQIRQKDLLARIISIIRNRYNKEKELISGDEIIAILQSEGVDDILKIEEAFFNLKKKGDILEPRVNKFKVI